MNDSRENAAIPDNLRTGTEAAQDAVNHDAIASLVEETHHPFDVVTHVYEKEFAQLSAHARITDYLVLFASRRMRDVLTHRRA